MEIIKPDLLDCPQMAVKKKMLEILNRNKLQGTD